MEGSRKSPRERRPKQPQFIIIDQTPAQKKKPKPAACAASGKNDDEKNEPPVTATKLKLISWAGEPGVRRMKDLIACAHTHKVYSYEKKEERDEAFLDTLNDFGKCASMADVQLPNA